MTKLFSPVRVGDYELAHRVVMAPLTRYRCDEAWVPLPMVKEYYTQRACVPGTLIITEGTLISKRHAARPNVPGIWSEAQISAWKEIVDAVHAKGCRIWCQLWSLGRGGTPEVLKSVDSHLMSSSAVPLKGKGKQTPLEMSEEDIQTTIQEYGQAARNAMVAGFDGVELHGGNGYLPDQFLQDTCNKRTDTWGGSVENRCRFHVEVTKAMAAAAGPHRTAVRLSPWSDFNDMLMEDPMPTFSHLVSELKKMNLGFLDLIEARIRGNDDCDLNADKDVSWLVKLWDNTCPVMLNGGFTAESARKTVDEKYTGYDVCIIFGRYFVSNPDLVHRVKQSLEFTKYDRATFYTPKLEKGYIDWAYHESFAGRT